MKRLIVVVVSLALFSCEKSSTYMPGSITNTGTYTNLYSLNSGVEPSNMVLSGNTFYVATSTDGSNTYGDIFSVGINGSGYQQLCSFSGGANGEWPFGLAVSNNVLYGMTPTKGANNAGNIFSVHTDGSGFQVLYSFTIEYPAGNLIVSGNQLFGAAMYGGAYLHDSGGIFTVHTDGSGYKKIYNFTGTTNYFPTGNLVLAGKTLYGTAAQSVFAVDTDGSRFRTLTVFNGGSGNGPTPGLLLSGGILYGCTSGALGNGVIYSIDTGGTVFTVVCAPPQFAIAPNNYINFDCEAPLLISGSTLYGVGYEYNTIFSVNTDGSNFQILYNAWNDNTKVGIIQPSLTLANGTFYGMGTNGGATGTGGIFSYTP